MIAERQNSSISSVNSSGNIFADMGFNAAAAECLAAKSAMIIMVKQIIAERALTRKAAASVCGTDQTTLSKVLHGRMADVTTDRLASWLTSLGQDIEITVRPAPETRHGRLYVAAAV